ncbi:MAG: universal stress protein [Pseudomonadales bacterium]|nr:universal stress protein [Pseudomonadales bacterium]
MSSYKKILVAVDLSGESELVIARASELGKHYEAQLSLVHVVEPIAVGYAVEVSSVDIEGLHEEAVQQARESLSTMGSHIGVPEDRLHTLLGQPAREIRELAKNIDADLIVMGGHGRHGWQLLFGSTPNSVLHGVECDLLTVHIPE